MVLSVEGSAGLCSQSRKRAKGELEGLCSSSQRSVNVHGLVENRVCVALVRVFFWPR